MAQHASLLPEIACLLGCDYIKRIPDQGGVKVLKNGRLFQQYVETELNKRCWLLEGISKCPAGHGVCFECTVGLFQYYPTYHPKKQELALLHDIPSNLSQTSWKDIIGFDKPPFECLPQSICSHKNMQKAYKLHGASFLHDGSTLPAYSKGPTYSGRFNEAISPEAKLPPFADVEFECHMPLGCCPSEVLYALLASHGCSMLDDDK
jgi:hypothetical protein